MKTTQGLISNRPCGGSLGTVAKLAREIPGNRSFAPLKHIYIVMKMEVRDFDGVGNDDEQGLMMMIMGPNDPLRPVVGLGSLSAQPARQRRDTYMR